ncbi:hypothetical protein CWI75_03320 [Kineobactrum sediminis]|uniref:Thioredoxin domain-containing protein n=1 Tax=Kineobactrum sediminis TaxID=1905677 RepID=A0A2N5Y7K6_9GAMM|nr:hypothetical protein [Kineobactrum sediminis]PLW84383.1 hypothetical protein CWI75_03320 [Kineobactrum sediminis]
MQAQQPNTDGRRTLLLIAGIPVTIILAASWLWWFVVQGNLDIVEVLGTANKGELVTPPRSLAEAETVLPSGNPLPWVNSDRQWTLLVANAGASCGAQCEHNLYLTRQIHTAMGKYFPRLRRFYIGDHAAAQTGLDVASLSDSNPVPANLERLLERDHPGLTVLEVAPAEYRALFPETTSAADTWYLADPAGWIMMSYNAGDNYKDVISDLKFLLKNSGN